MAEALAVGMLDVLARACSVKATPIEGFPILQVSDRWQAQAMEQAADIATATTIAELEAAIADSAYSAIYIPKRCFGPQTLTHILARQSVTKPLYLEADHG